MVPLSTFSPDAVVYNIPASVRLYGPLKPACDGHCELVRRHDALRTTFAHVDGQPRQIIQASWTRLGRGGPARSAGELREPRALELGQRRRDDRLISNRDHSCACS